MKEKIKFANEEFNSYKAAFERAKELPSDFYRAIYFTLDSQFRLTLRKARLAKTFDDMFEVDTEFEIERNVMSKLASEMDEVDSTLGYFLRQDLQNMVENLAEIKSKKNLV